MELEFSSQWSLEDLKQCTQEVVDYFNIIPEDENLHYIKENKEMKNLKLEWTDHGAIISKGMIHDHVTQIRRRQKERYKMPLSGRIKRRIPKKFPRKYLVTTKYLLRTIQMSMDRTIYHKRSTIDEFLQQLKTFTLSNAWGDENNMRNALIFHQNIEIALKEISDALSLPKEDIEKICKKMQDDIRSVLSGHDIKLTVRETNEKGGDDEDDNDKTYEMNLTSTSLDSETNEKGGDDEDDNDETYEMNLTSTSLDSETNEKGGDDEDDNDETYEMNLTSTSLDWDLTWNIPVTQMYTLKYVIMDAKQQIDSTVVGDSLLRGGQNLHTGMNRFQNGAKLILTFEKMASESTSAKSRDKSDNKIDGYESAAGPKNSKSGGEIEVADRSESNIINSDDDSSESVADRSESNIINSDDDSSESVAAPNHSDSGGKKIKKKRQSRCESLSSCVVSFRF